MPLFDPDLSLRDLQAAVAAQTRVRPSPDVAAALICLLQDPPYTSQPTKGMWRQVLALLVETHAFAESVAPLTVLAADYQKVMGPTVVGRGVEFQLRRSLKVLQARFPNAPTTVVAKPKPIQKTKSGVAVDDLYADVAAHDDDDNARLVLADALLDLGDARGDFIALQVRAHRGETLSKDELAREKALLAAHEKEWLGPVAEVTNKPSRVWRRGFLDECEFLPRGKFLDKATGHPAWSMVRVLDVRAAYAKGHGLLSHPVLGGVRVLRNAPTELLDRLCKQPSRIEELSGDLETDDDDMYLPMLTAFPSLRTLEFTGLRGNDPAWMDPLWTSPLGKRLELLRFPMDSRCFAKWPAAILANAKMAVEVVPYWATIRFDGKRVTITDRHQHATGDNRDAALLTMVGAFRPQQLSALTIDNSLRTPQLDAAIAELGGRLEA